LEAVLGILQSHAQFGNKLIDFRLLILEGLGHDACLLGEGLVVLTGAGCSAVDRGGQLNAGVSPLAFRFEFVAFPGSGSFSGAEALLILGLHGEVFSLTVGNEEGSGADIHALHAHLRLDNHELGIICCEDADSLGSCFRDLGGVSQNRCLDDAHEGDFLSNNMLLLLRKSLHVSVELCVPSGVSRIIARIVLNSDRSGELRFRSRLQFHHKGDPPLVGVGELHGPFHADSVSFVHGDACLDDGGIVGNERCCEGFFFEGEVEGGLEAGYVCGGCCDLGTGGLRGSGGTAGLSLEAGDFNVHLSLG
jgi:hypothetical protein